MIIDLDAVIECVLGVIDAVGILSQSGMRGQDDEASGLDGRAEQAEDPLGDQQTVQVRLTQSPRAMIWIDDLLKTARLLTTSHRPQGFC
ncbi:hypothetical protein [Streptomyces xanthophaeus]|uniref:hypothetical protein n=1 Tax=Streptomyces xanthophaeus TaxID=67385 RepID=UPI003870D604